MPHNPLHLVSAVASGAALVVACVALLRPPAPAGDPAALAAVRQELAELRRSVDITRGQASGPSGFTDLAALERRLAVLEGRPAPAAPVPPASSVPAPSAADEAPPAAPTPSPTSATKTGPAYSSPYAGLRVELGRDGRPVVQNTDPSLTGQKMTLHGTDAEGRPVSLEITVPPPA